MKKSKQRPTPPLPVSAADPPAATEPVAMEKPSAAFESLPPATPPAAPAGAMPRSPSADNGMWSMLQLPLAVLIALAALAYLLWPEGRTDDNSGPVAAEVQIVKLDSPHRLTIVPGTPLEKKLAVVPVDAQETSAPRLKVTGSVVARLARAANQESSKIEGRWDFSSPDLASAYADWLKARNDVPFLDQQRKKVFELSKANLDAKKEVAERLEKLVTAGTDPVKDLVAAKADLLQTQIQGEKDNHEAQTNVDNARRTLATLERQLFQAGVDPDLLLHGETNTAVVMADVPEAKVSLARPGDPCSAQFYAFPDIQFSAVVGSVSPTISKERRTLCAFFQVHDPKGLLKPGMFADVNLCTDKRAMLMVPADGVLHVGRFDYVLVAGKANEWKVTAVKAGEQYGNKIEVLQGLHGGERVIGEGAILLKPYVVEDVQAAADSVAPALIEGRAKPSGVATAGNSASASQLLDAVPRGSAAP